jgi:hypothetical protein
LFTGPAVFLIMRAYLGRSSLCYRRFTLDK